MKLSRHAGQKRFGFTLIEILVVVAIIAILAGLIIPAVFYFLRSGQQTVTFNELLQLDSAIGYFKTTYKVDYVPSQIKLCEQFGQYQITENGASTDNQLDRDSVTFLLRVFPYLGGGQALWKTRGIDWNGDGNYGTPAVILEGDRCLVFFLGGIPVRSGPTMSVMGFNKDPNDPAKPGDLANRTPPIMNFDSRRLFLRAAPISQHPLQAAAAKAGYLSYADPYFSGGPPGQDQPYLYFSAYGVNDGYNKYGTDGDCPSFGTTPYASSLSPPIYYNPKSHQIISAGIDQLFGPGGLWNPATIALGKMPLAANDDQTNFTGGKLIGAGF